MSLLFFDGFQDTVLMPKNEWAPGGQLSAQTGRDGTANGAMQTRNTGGPSARILTLPTAAATCICGIASNGMSQTYSLMFQTSGNVTQVWVGVNAIGLIEARRTNNGGALLGTSSGHSTINTGDWHYYEVKVVMSSTATGSVIVRLDGVAVLTATAVITSSVTASVTNIRIDQNTGTGATCWWDDMYVCDTADGTATQGRANNDFLGDLKVVSLFPNAAGDTTGWTPSTGANWDTANESPPNTTDYVSSAVAGTRDLYNMTDLPGVVTAVYGVRTNYYTTKSDAGGTVLKPVIKENSVVTVDTPYGVTFGAWVIVCGTVLWLRPSDSTVWTAANVAGIQVGMEVG